MESSPAIFLVALAFVAFAYASVGHGGASGYLALMALFNVAPEAMRASALVLNIIVSLLSFTAYARGGHFRKELFWPFALASVPMAFAGGLITVDTTLYRRLLGVCLVLATLRIIYPGNSKEDLATRQLPFPIGFTLGGVLGFFSGLIGIGGGIVLSPLLLVFRWASIRETAAVSSLFILVNSVAGVIGVWKGGGRLSSEILLWVVIACGAGFLGARAGSIHLSGRLVRYLLALVLFVASLKLMIL